MPATTFRTTLHAAAARIARDGFRPRGTHSAREVAAYLQRRTGTTPCADCGLPLPTRGTILPSHHAPACPALAPRRPAVTGAPVALQVMGYHTGAALRGFHGEASPVLPRYIGVEVESCVPRSCTPVVEARLVECARTWGATSDSSISPGMGQRGVEWVSPAMRGTYAIDQITRLSRALVSARAQVTACTGLHVHVDARDLDPGQWVGAARLAIFIEPLFYSIVTRSRRTGGFSDPRSHPVDPSARIAGTPRVAALNGSLGFTSRYHGVNLTNRGGKNTIEFRHHHGTIDHKKIIPWARILVAVVEYAKRHGVDAVCEVSRLDPKGALAVVLAAVYGSADADALMAWVTERQATLARA